MYFNWKKLMTCCLSLSGKPCLSHAFLACISLALVRAWLDSASRMADKMNPLTTAKPLQTSDAATAHRMGQSMKSNGFETGQKKRSKAAGHSTIDGQEQTDDALRKSYNRSNMTNARPPLCPFKHSMRLMCFKTAWQKDPLTATCHTVLCAAQPLQALSSVELASDPSEAELTKPTQTGGVVLHHRPNH
jgi:hypothetical protein